MGDDDDFTFPTTVVAAPPPDAGRRGHVGVPGIGSEALSLAQPGGPAPALWPFAPPPCTKATASSPPPVTTAARKEAAPAAASRSGGRAEDEAEESSRRRLAAREERMDLLWEADTATTAAPSRPTSRGGGGLASGRPPPEQRLPRACKADRGEADERMDLLWESFNEELLLLRRRARPKQQHAAATDHRGDDPADGWFLCPSPPSDAEGSSGGTSASSPAEPRGQYRGCAPTMLRASSRAGGVGQFYGGRRRRGAAAGWALLLRLFRRLFAVDKATPSRGSGTIYVP